MSKPLSTLTMITLVSLTATLVNARSTSFEIRERSPHKVIVKYKRNSSLISSTSSLIKASFSAIKSKQDSSLKMEYITLEPHQNLDKTIETLNEMDDVEYAEPDYLVKAIDIRIEDIHAYAPDVSKVNWGLNIIGAPDAWRITYGNPNITVAIIDSGIDPTHPDLADNLWINHGEIAGDGIDNDNNGYVDDVWGWNFAENNNNPSDTINHGTHVAGIIGADGYGSYGISGVSKIINLMAVKFISNDGYGQTSSAIASIMYAINNGAKILNNSWGNYNYSQALNDAVNYANRSNTLFVAAAGNEGINNDRRDHYPSNYSQENVLAVGASNESDRTASFSNYGEDTVDIMAPGTNIINTVKDGYASLSGTSMSAPFAAGVAALILSDNPNIDAYNLKRIILESGDRVSSYQSSNLTSSRINANNALILAQSSPDAVSKYPMTPQRQPFIPVDIIGNDEEASYGCGKISSNNNNKAGPSDLSMILVLVLLPLAIVVNKKFRYIPKL